jgi:type VI secretion system lysozyme-like protein
MGIRNIIQESFAEPKRQQGAPIPLFEKLIDEDKDGRGEAPPKRFYNQAEVMQSIEMELSRILNTRANAKKIDYDFLSSDDRNFGLPHLYGLADFSQYDAANQSNYPRIAKLCETAIRFFEPRLSQATVTITGFDTQKTRLSAVINARLNLRGFQGEVTFPVDIAVLV